MYPNPAVWVYIRNLTPLLLKRESVIAENDPRRSLTACPNRPRLVINLITLMKMIHAAALRPLGGCCRCTGSSPVRQHVGKDLEASPGPVGQRHQEPIQVRLISNRSEKWQKEAAACN